MTIALQSNVGQTITPSVLVGPTADDPVPANNTSNTATTSITNADLSLTKLVPSPTSITIGGSTLVTGTVTNVGAGAANGVIYQLLIPSAWTFDASRTVVKVGTTATSDTCTRSTYLTGTDQIRCPLAAPLAAGGVVTVALGVTPDAIGVSTVYGATFFGQTDPDTSNNNRSAKVTVLNGGVDATVALSGSGSNWTASVGPFPAGAFLGPTVQGDSLLSRDRLVVLLSGVELYQMFDTRSPNTKWVSATLGLAQVSSRLSDGEVQFPLEGDGPFLGVGAGLEHFFHRSWAWTADAHYHAIFHGGQVNHDLQASVGMIFYVAY